MIPNDRDVVDLEGVVVGGDVWDDPMRHRAFGVDEMALCDSQTSRKCCYRVR